MGVQLTTSSRLESSGQPASAAAENMSYRTCQSSGDDMLAVQKYGRQLMQGAHQTYWTIYIWYSSP